MGHRIRRHPRAPATLHDLEQVFFREWQNTTQDFPARHVCPRVAEHYSGFSCSSCLAESGRTLLNLSLLMVFVREWQSTPDVTILVDWA